MINDIITYKQGDKLGLPKSMFLGMIDGDSIRIIGKAADGTIEELSERNHRWTKTTNHPHNDVRRRIKLFFENPQVASVSIEPGWNKRASREDTIRWNEEEAKLKELLADTAIPEGYDFNMAHSLDEYTTRRLAKIVKVIREYAGGSTFWARVTPTHNGGMQLEVYHIRGAWANRGLAESYVAIVSIMINAAAV